MDRFVKNFARMSQAARFTAKYFVIRRCAAELNQIVDSACEHPSGSEDYAEAQQPPHHYFKPLVAPGLALCHGLKRSFQALKNHFKCQRGDYHAENQPQRSYFRTRQNS